MTCQEPNIVVQETDAGPRQETVEVVRSGCMGFVFG